MYRPLRDQSISLPACVYVSGGSVGDRTVDWMKETEKIWVMSYMMVMFCWRDLREILSCCWAAFCCRGVDACPPAKPHARWLYPARETILLTGTAVSEMRSRNRRGCEKRGSVFRDGFPGLSAPAKALCRYKERVAEGSSRGCFGRATRDLRSGVFEVYR